MPETMTTMTHGVHADSPPEGYLTGVRFEHLVVLNKRTNDGRLLRDGGFSTRELPMPFSSMFATTHGEPGQAVVTGILDEVTVNDDGTVDGRGWLLDTMTARQAGSLIQRKAVYGNSIELSVRKVDLKWDSDESKLLVDFLDYQLAATTQVARPAMEGCFVYLEDETFDFGDLGENFDDAATQNLVESNLPAVTVGAGHYDGSFSSFTVVEDPAEVKVELSGNEPPAEWFAHPDLGQVTPIQVEAPVDGLCRVQGYLCGWDSEHLGVAGIRLYPPRTGSDYPYFATGSVLCADGSMAPTGRLTYGGSHAEAEVDWQAAVAHYDNTCSAWADVAIGEDDLGVWVAGYVRPGTDAAVVAMGRASALSGDWRRVRGRLELVGALSVNSPGFPIARPNAFAEDGVQTSLIGAFIAPTWKAGTEAGNLLPPDALADLKVVANDVRRREVEAVEAALAESEITDLEGALG